MFLTFGRIFGLTYLITLQNHDLYETPFVPRPFR